jgi:hypothetical protein
MLQKKKIKHWLSQVGTLCTLITYIGETKLLINPQQERSTISTAIVTSFILYFSYNGCLSLDRKEKLMICLPESCNTLNTIAICCYRCGISSLTGGEIALLASMRVECPDFFYKCLQDMLRVKDLLTMSKIVWALHDLS